MLDVCFKKVREALIGEADKKFVVACVVDEDYTEKRSARKKLLNVLFPFFFIVSSRSLL